MKKHMLSTLVFLVLLLLVPIFAASADEITIPDFAAYAGDEIAKTETYDGLTIYFLPQDRFSKVLAAYTRLLESDYGFLDLRTKTVDSAGYIWFANHATVSPESFEDTVIEGNCSFLFAGSNAGDGLGQVFLLPGNGFVMADTGERYAAAPEATAQPQPTEAPIPETGLFCEACEGTGECQNCGGDMWFEGYKYVWQGLGGSGYENEYVVELCHEDNCFAGSCKTCGGDGEI